MTDAQWPRTKNGWTQVVGVCDARGAAYLAFGWFDLTPVMYADFGAHDVRASNWNMETASHA